MHEGTQKHVMTGCLGAHGIRFMCLTHITSIYIWFHILFTLIEKQNNHISAFEVNVYLSAGGYLGDKFQDKYFFVWPGSQRFSLDTCEIVLHGSGCSLKDRTVARFYNDT